MSIIGLDMNVLTGWYQSKINTSLANSTALSSKGASSANSAKDVKTPWDVRDGGVQSLEDMRRSVLASGVYFNSGKSEFSNVDAPDDHKALFDMYQGLKRMAAVTEEAMDKLTLDTRRKFLNSRLQDGVSQFQSFYDNLDLEGATLLSGEKVSKAESEVAISRGKSEYFTGAIHSGAFDAEVASLTGDVQFNIAVKKNGVTTNIAINLADMGTTTRNLDNISAHINTQLEAAGMLSTFSRSKVGVADENGVIPGSNFGFKVSGILT